MHPRDIAAALTSRGLDPDESPAKAGLYESVLSAFRRDTSRDPGHAWWVPGRLEVFGTHTDYAGGRTLIAAVPRGFAFAAAARDDRTVRILDARTGEGVTIRASGPPETLSGWRRYCAVVVQRLSRNFADEQFGADVMFASDLPRASGMSSSSALIVGLATALVRVTGLDRRASWKAAIGGPLDAAAYYACLESGMPFGALDGDAGVGTHGGSEDHVAMLCGEPGSLLECSFVPARPIGRVQMPRGWQFVIMSSGVASEKGGGAQAAYNGLARGAAVLLDLWNRSNRPAPSLGAALGEGAVAVEQLRAIIRHSSVDGWPRDVLEARLTHFIREDARVPDAVAAFRAADAVRLRALSEASQADAETLLGNQIPETAALPRLALMSGAFASRSFGAGFGGSVWALVERDAAAAFAVRWLAAYRAGYPAGERATVFNAAPGPPLTEVS
jgi:galactokinase